MARQGFEALMSGEDKVVAGSFKNKVEAVVAPKARQHRKLAERDDDSDHQG